MYLLESLPLPCYVYGAKDPDQFSRLLKEIRNRSDVFLLLNDDEKTTGYEALYLYQLNKHGPILCFALFPEDYQKMQAQDKLITPVRPIFPIELVQFTSKSNQRGVLLSSRLLINCTKKG